jgi:hypothetical protein
MSDVVARSVPNKRADPCSEPRTPPYAGQADVDNSRTIDPAGVEVANLERRVSSFEPTASAGRKELRRAVAHVEDDVDPWQLGDLAPLAWVEELANRSEALESSHLETCSRETDTRLAAGYWLAGHVGCAMVFHE